MREPPNLDINKRQVSYTRVPANAVDKIQQRFFVVPCGTCCESVTFSLIPDDSLNRFANGANPLHPVSIKTVHSLMLQSRVPRLYGAADTEVHQPNRSIIILQSRFAERLVPADSP